MANGDDPPVTADDLADLGALVRQIKVETGLSWTALAAESGIPDGTLSSIAGGTYKVAGASKQPALVRKWLNARKERARLAAVIPSAPRFVATPTASNLLSIFGFAQVMPDVAIVAGNPGIGKTMAAREYIEKTPNSWLITAEKATAAVNPMLGLICDGLGITRGASAQYSARIQERLRPLTDALLIIDEAQNLRQDTVDQMRSIHDLAGVGMVLIGNLEVVAMIDGMAGKPAFITAKSRVGMRETLTALQERDLLPILNAWGVDDDAERRLLRAVAHKPGALRNVSKVLRLAGVLAAGANSGEGESRTVEHIRAAAARLGFSTPAVDPDAA